MILEVGSTTLTFNYTDNNIETTIEKTTKKSSGGKIKQQITGERLEIEENLVVTGSEYRSLINVLKDNNSEFYYTPSFTPAGYSDSDFPMKVSFSGKIKISKTAWNGTEKVYYINLSLESIDYL